MNPLKLRIKIERQSWLVGSLSSMPNHARWFKILFTILDVTIGVLVPDTKMLDCWTMSTGDKENLVPEMHIDNLRLAILEAGTGATISLSELMRRFSLSREDRRIWG